MVVSVACAHMAEACRHRVCVCPASVHTRDGNPLRDRAVNHGRLSSSTCEPSQCAVCLGLAVWCTVHGHLPRSAFWSNRMAALLRRVLEKERSGAPLPLPAVASGVRGSRFATAFGRMLQARSLRCNLAPGCVLLYAARHRVLTPK